MANILSLAMKVSADASGVVKSLTPAERALENLGKQAANTASVFDEFAAGNSAAAAAQRQLATDFGFLTSALKTGQITAEQFAAEYATLEKAAKGTAEAFSEGVRLIQANASAEQLRSDRIARLSELLRLGAIDERTYGLEVAKVTGATEAAVQAEAERQRVLSQGLAIARQFATEDEKRAESLAEIDRLLKAGAITEETASRARAEFSGQNASFLALQKEATAEQIRQDQIRLQTATLSAQAIAEFEREQADLSAKQTDSYLRQQSQAFAESARIIEQNLSPQEKYDRQIQDLQEHLNAGRLSQEQFNRAAAKAGDELNGVGKQANKTDKEISQLNKSVTLLSRIEVGRLIIDGMQALSSVFTRVGSQVTALVSNVNTGVDSLNDLSARTGIGVEALQGYSFAAKLAGVDTEQFGAAVQKLAVNIGQATPGDALDKALKGINLSLADLRALSPEQQFSEIGSAISQLPTAADRAAAAVAIFGKQGAALAPLFREGAASLKELRVEAKQLGAIVSNEQVANIGDMNDAFGKIGSSIQGIIGQVLGNLAPAVTAVTDQIIEYIKVWEGTGSQGTGGTGIANAITDVLLEGATYFAAVFDDFINRFDSLGISLQGTSETFNSSASAFVFVSEGLRAVANVFELAGNALSAALGKIIETLGSFVSDDLEQYGKELTRQAMIATQKNSRELEDAAANAGQAFVGIFTGGGSGTAAQAGEGAASEFLQGLRAKIENSRLPEVQVQANLASATADLDQFLSTAEGGTSAFLEQSQATLATFSQMAAEGQLTADQIEIMNGFMENLNAELVKEKQNRQAATDAAEAQVDADRKRLDQLLQTNDEAARLEQDLLTVEREQARVSEQLAAARASDNVAQADAAAARKAELDQLQAKLEEQQQALGQGFGQGFQAAFATVDNGINGLIAKSQQFGQAGFDAALRLQEGIAYAQEQARDGILNQEAFNQEVARQQELFNKEIENLEKIKNTKKKNADDVGALEKSLQEKAISEQKAYQEQQQKAVEEYQKQQQEAQKAYAQEQARIQEERRKAAEAEAARQEERLRKLNTLGQQSIKATDIRTVEGATLVTDLAASAQDPAMIQQRLQTKLLEKIATGIGQAAANYFNTPVAIVGAARVGGFNQ